MSRRRPALQADLFRARALDQPLVSQLAVLRTRGFFRSPLTSGQALLREVRREVRRS
jgi:hypothetical protein